MKPSTASAPAHRCPLALPHLTPVAMLAAMTLLACGAGQASRPEAGTPSPTDGAVGSEASTAGEALLTITPLIYVSLIPIELGESATTTAVVTNQGTAPSGVLQVSAGAGLAVTGCVGVLPARRSCTLTITMTPTRAGTFRGTFSVTADPGALTPLEVIVGTSVDLFKVSPEKLELGSIAVNGTAKRTITITAVGDLNTLMVTSTNAPDMTIDTTGTCTMTLATGASCTADVTFHAGTEVGARRESIVVSANKAADPTDYLTVGIPITAEILPI